MNKINPTHISNAVLTIDFAIHNNLIQEKEIIEWADKIVMTEKEPDIFFIELSMAGSKGIKNIVTYLNNYVLSEADTLSVKPILGFMHKKYSNGEIFFADMIHKLYQLKYQLVLSEKEENFIMLLDHEYDTAIYYEDENALLSIEKKLIKFLRIYKDYLLPNFKDWENMDKIANENFDNLFKEVWNTKQP